MSNRPYVSSIRTAAAEEKRKAVLNAATDLLRRQSISEFSLETVGKAAGVTRLTVYNQFGSRRGLLEAVLDELAERGKLLRLPKALEATDPNVALNDLIDIFCEFWAGDAALGQLHDAIALDAEFGEVLQSRSELRRKALSELIKRMNFPNATAQSKRETTDLLYTLTSCAFYRSLSMTQSDMAIKRIIKRTSTDAIARLAK